MNALDEFSPVLPGRTSGGATILVVDDEVAVRRFAMRVLEREGYSVCEAKDGAEALEMVRAGPVSIEVVVSDIVMPRLNGVELIQALATTNPSLPVILMSGYTTAALSELSIATPCAVLAKPFAPERLVEEVERCIKRPAA